MKKILILSELYYGGGSGNATNNIYSLLKKEFSEVFLLIPLKKISKENDKNILSYYNNFTYLIYFLFKLFDRFLSRIFSKNQFYFFYNIFDISLYNFNKIQIILKKYEITCVVVLWYEYILNIQTITRLKKENNNIKIIIFSFDMFNFTGGCRYSQSCKNFEKECLDCPAVLNFLKPIVHKKFLKSKLLYNEVEVDLIVNSNFAKEIINKTKLINSENKVNVIHYPVYNLIAYDQIRLEIKLLKNNLTNKKIIFFGAQNFNEWRKGVFVLKDILLILKNKNPKLFSNLFFIFIGSNYKKVDIFDDNNYKSFSKVNLDELYYIYNISDLIIIPSLQEWGSLMMSEASFFKKNIFCFETGSSKDLVLNYVNGYIAKVNDKKAFVNNLEEYLLDENKFLYKRTSNTLNKLYEKKDLKVILNQFSGLINNE
jgi:glycosyltransferase involved in cell wall biosynthesis